MQANQIGMFRHKHDVIPFANQLGMFLHKLTTPNLDWRKKPLDVLTRALRAHNDHERKRHL